MNALVRAQAGVQAWLRPGVWLPCARDWHHEVHEWASPSLGADELLDKVWSIAKDMELEGRALEQYDYDKAGKRIVLNYFTAKAKWLDQLELTFVSAGSGCTVRVRAYSTGVLPLLVPLAPLLNVIFMFFPFQDANGKCNAEIEELRAEVVKAVSDLSSTVVVYSKGNPARQPLQAQVSSRV
jgi:hypothetical protein